MDTQSIAIAAAVIGFLATLVYLALGVMGIKALKDIRDSLWRRNGRTERDEPS
jgi:hypothetical protein